MPQVESAVADSTVQVAVKTQVHMTDCIELFSSITQSVSPLPALASIPYGHYSTF